VSVCASVQVTVVPLLAPVFAFESTPEPLHVPARLIGTGGNGSAGDPLGCDDTAGGTLGCGAAAGGDPLGCADAVGDTAGGDATSGDPLPPQETSRTERAVATMIDRVDFMTNDHNINDYYYGRGPIVFQ
jgi:hypothetical protein